MIITGQSNTTLGGMKTGKGEANKPVTGGTPKGSVLRCAGGIDTRSPKLNPWNLTALEKEVITNRSNLEI